MKKILLVAVILAGVSGLAQSQDQSLLKEIEKGRQEYDGIIAGKAADVVAVDGADGFLRANKNAAVPSRVGASKTKKQLPPRVTENTMIARSEKPAEGPPKHIGALVLGIILGAILMRRVIEVHHHYEGDGGSSWDNDEINQRILY